MERILTKEEIADLLSAVRQGEVQIEPELAPGGPVATAAAAAEKIDLFSGSGQERWQLPNFDLILDSFGRHYATSLANRIQRAVTIKLSGFESMFFGRFLQDASDRGAIGVIEMEPLRGDALLFFDVSASLTLVELVLGGAIGLKTLPDRRLTAIELNVMRDVISACCPDLRKCFEQLVDLKPELFKVENNPRQLTRLADDAGVIVARYQVQLGEIPGEMQLLLPHSALEPLSEKKQESAPQMSAARTSQWQHTISHELDQMEVELEAQLAQVSLRIRDILAFEVGDVIDLDCDPDSPLTVLVEGQPKFKGLAGVYGTQKAVQLTGEVLSGG